MTDIDINKLIMSSNPVGDPQRAVRESEIAGWSKAGAMALAKADGLELTAEHWPVIEFLQRLYVERGRAPSARLVSSALNTAFDAQGGSRYLYQLFPGGPVAQGSRLAGVAAPHDTQDPSFGSTF